MSSCKQFYGLNNARYKQCIVCTLWEPLHIPVCGFYLPSFPPTNFLHSSPVIDIHVSVPPMSDCYLFSLHFTTSFILLTYVHCFTFYLCFFSTIAIFFIHKMIKHLVCPHVSLCHLCFLKFIISLFFSIIYSGGGGII